MHSRDVPWKQQDLEVTSIAIGLKWLLSPTQFSSKDGPGQGQNSVPMGGLLPPSTHRLAPHTNVLINKDGRVTGRPGADQEAALLETRGVSFHSAGRMGTGPFGGHVSQALGGTGQTRQ